MPDLKPDFDTLMWTAMIIFAFCLVVFLLSGYVLKHRKKVESPLARLLNRVGFFGLVLAMFSVFIAMLLK